MPRDRIRTYNVEGFGPFPVDMLRYDNAEYALQADRERAEDKRNRRIIMLKGPEPTRARWESFMWRVLD